MDDLYVDLGDFSDHSLYLKCEGFNFAASIKLKAAAQMVTRAEREGTIGPGATLVESSSGNLGVALSIVAISRGYRFICVTDSRCTLAARQLMQSLGAEVHVITEPEAGRGLLGARLKRVQGLCSENENCVWLNQYGNPANWMAHYQSTAPEILRDFPDIDVLFVGAGTTGTLMGCARYFRKVKPSVRIVAVDTIGSVTFGSPSAQRLIPGLGTSVRPQLVDESYLDDVRHVAEKDTVRACRALVRRGFVFGGSTGTVVSGAVDWLAEHGSRSPVTAVAIAPDLGERYLDTVYNDQWVSEIYGAEVLEGGIDRSRVASGLIGG